MSPREGGWRACAASKRIIEIASMRLLAAHAQTPPRAGVRARASFGTHARIKHRRA